ncbi:MULTISPECIES: sterol desaturase family protein [unclassified Streptomyces]|uniref:sterol desaturase family protein n=1 Tax=unclassified Streptomyces TaxID=2593676 RepID=UPI0020359CCC|nr:MULTISPECIES: sterol desaturase family protein [unclassified Streptomyces]
MPTTIAPPVLAIARFLVRYAYLPFMLLGVNGAAIWLVAADAPKLWLLAVVAFAVGCSFAAERVLPYRPAWNTPRGDGRRDTAHAFVNEVFTLAGLAVVPAAAALAPAPQAWPDNWPLWCQVLLAIAVADLGLTLAHRASHHVGWLWRLHAVHHSVTRFYGFNGLMKHPLHQTLETLGGVTPLLLLGMPLDVASVLATAVAVQLLLQHSNADYRTGLLTPVLALNQGHRFHHLKWAGIGDVNFGLFTLVWDHAMGTYTYDPDRQFTSDDLGMAAKPHYPNTYLAQLGEPFRPDAPRTGARP